MSDYGLKWSAVENTTTVGRDRPRHRTLRGGLGVLGVGQMWTSDMAHWEDDPAWVNAPDLTEAEWYDHGAGTSTPSDVIRHQYDRLRHNADEAERRGSPEGATLIRARAEALRAEWAALTEPTP